MFGYIYRTHNKINGRMYVGQKKSKVFLAEKYLGSGKILGQAVEKYGKENFYVELLEEVNVTQEDLDAREEYWGDLLNVVEDSIYYNICRCGSHGPGGTSITGFYGHHHSEETLAKMSENRKGEKNSNYGNRWHRTPDMAYGSQAGENNSMYGKHHSDETKAKLSARASDLIWVCNGIDKPERIHIWELDEYISKGFHRGRK